MRKSILFFVFIFVFLSPVYAQVTLSNIPNFDLDFNDYDSFDIDNYATNHSNSANTISFTNPQTGAGVTLFGDTGGTHTNNRFSITLNTNGLVQFASYEINMNARPIQVCIGQSFNTLACDTFYLSISQTNNAGPLQVASFNNYNVTAGTINLNLNNFFTSFNRYSISYSDTTNSQSVFIQRSQNQGPLSYIGDYITTIAYNPNPILTIASNGKNAFKLLNLTLYNNVGQTSVMLNISSYSNININNTPIQVQSFTRTYTQNLGTPLTIYFGDYVTGYTRFGIDYIGLTGTGAEEGFNICRSTSSISPLISTTSTGITTDFSRFFIDSRNPITFSASQDREITLLFYYRNTDGLCGFTGTSLILPSDVIGNPTTSSSFNITIDFTNNPNSITIEPDTNPNLISRIINLVYSWFPEATSLNIRQKWAYVLVSLLVPMFIFLAISIGSEGSINPKSAMYLGSFFDVLLIFMFISIGYISLTTLIIILIIFLGIIYLRRS